MASDSERREVARRLRSFADRHDGVVWTFVEKNLGLVSDERFLGSSIYTSDSVLHVADLIEPSCDRDALLALADEMEQETGSVCGVCMGKSARRIREALSVSAST